MGTQNILYPNLQAKGVFSPISPCRGDINIRLSCCKLFVFVYLKPDKIVIFVINIWHPTSCQSFEFRTSSVFRSPLYKPLQTGIQNFYTQTLSWARFEDFGASFDLVLEICWEGSMTETGICFSFNILVKSFIFSTESDESIVVLPLYINWKRESHFQNGCLINPPPLPSLQLEFSNNQSFSQSTMSTVIR